MSKEINRFSDYKAFKNEMLKVYPETKMVFSEVYKGDEFFFKDVNGKVDYTHTFKNPFEKDLSKIIGLYCVIKNKRGEFMTFLNTDEIANHRKVAKTDKIWKDWELEMMYKTIIKKAVKVHFDDVYTEIVKLDNESIDLENPLDVGLEIKQDIENCKTQEELEAYYKKNKDSQKSTFEGFIKLLSKRKKELNKPVEEEKNENS